MAELQTVNGRKHAYPREVPPWMNDEEPDCWVPLWVAAEVYLRRSYGSVYQMATDARGNERTTLEEFGYPIYRLGMRIYVRLPVPIPPAKYPKHGPFSKHR